MIKILEPHTRLEMPDCVLLDFDGTISKLRLGWEQVMQQYMMECIPGDPEEVAVLAERYIDESAGIQTILQMRWMAQQVQERGGKALDAWEYKAEFGERMLYTVRKRKEDIALGRASADRYLVPGARELLQTLKDRGVSLYLASGTDDEQVILEAQTLQVADFFEEIAGAPHRVEGCPKEAALRKLMRPDSKMLVAGDGRVELQLARQSGAVALGIASWDCFDDLPQGLNPIKEKRLSSAGAHALVPDYTDLEQILQWL